MTSLVQALCTIAACAIGGTAGGLIADELIPGVIPKISLSAPAKPPVPGVSWETIDKDYGIKRTRTATGWLVFYSSRSGYGASAAMTFVPDPTHEWVIQ